MILFCDTSALVKLYAQELHSDWTRLQVEAAARCLVSEITWAEMCAALAMKGRTKQVTPDGVTASLARLRSEWDIYTGLAVDVPLIGHAGELALRFGLRAYDSIQLASAHKAAAIAGTALRLCCFDKQLMAAAQALGITPLQP